MMGENYRSFHLSHVTFGAEKYLQLSPKPAFITRRSSLEKEIRHGACKPVEWREGRGVSVVGVTVFEYNVSTILSSIVGFKSRLRIVQKLNCMRIYNSEHCLLLQ